MKSLGAVLIVVGLIALVWGGFTYTKREKVVDLGPIEATVDKEKRVPLPPLAGAFALVAGVILVSVSRGGPGHRTAR